MVRTFRRSELKDQLWLWCLKNRWFHNNSQQDSTLSANIFQDCNIGLCFEGKVFLHILSDSASLLSTTSFLAPKKYLTHTELKKKYSRWISLSSRLLRGINWFNTDVSGIPIASIFKNQQQTTFRRITTQKMEKLVFRAVRHYRK